MFFFSLERRPLIEPQREVMSMAERDSAAKRRRDRRLRMHWRNEKLTLQMALAAALRLSRDVGLVMNNAPREPEDCQGRGVGARDELHVHDPGPPSHSTHTPPAGALQLL